MSMQILTVSSKGQISLPVSIRKLLSIDTGDKLIAYTSGDVIMLKTLKLPSADDLKLRRMNPRNGQLLLVMMKVTSMISSNPQEGRKEYENCIGYKCPNFRCVFWWISQKKPQ